MLLYKENGIKKKMTVGDELAFVFRERSGDAGFSLLYSTWSGIKEGSYEKSVFHDLIYYLRESNYAKQGSHQAEDIQEENTILLSSILNNRISGRTNTLGATIYLINLLDMYYEECTAVPVLLDILAGMIKTTYFTKDNKGIPILDYKEHKFDCGKDEELYTLFPDEVDSRFHEGAKKIISVNSYERSKLGRNKCIEKYGFNCVICNFSFKKVYGKLGEGYIHVHHLKPLAEITREYTLDPVKDLRPVCPNCHAMLHRKGNISIKELMCLMSEELKRNQ